MTFRILQMFSQTGIGIGEKTWGKSRAFMSYDLVIIPFKILVNYCIEKGKPKNGKSYKGNNCSNVSQIKPIHFLLLKIRSGKIG